MGAIMKGNEMPKFCTKPALQKHGRLCMYANVFHQNWQKSINFPKPGVNIHIHHRSKGIKLI
jgi:hypothetical protein